MDQLCVVVYETDEKEKCVLRDSLIAYSVAENTEILIRWLHPSAMEAEIAAACAAARMAFVGTTDIKEAIRIGKALYRENPGCLLVYYGHFVPTETEELANYFCSLFPSRPILFLNHPSKRDYIQATDSLSKNSIDGELFVWENRGMRYRIPYGGILYFRSDRNYIYLRLKNGEELHFLGKLSNIEHQLPPRFFVRVHQSYLVNRTAIRVIDKQRKALRLSNGEEIYISKAHYKETLKI